MKYLLLLPLIFVVGCSNESEITAQSDSIVNVGAEESSSNWTPEKMKEDDDLDNDGIPTEKDAYEPNTIINYVGAEVVEKANQLDLSYPSDVETYLNTEFFPLGEVTYLTVVRSFSYTNFYSSDWRADVDLIVEASYLIKDFLGEGYSIIITDGNEILFKVTDGGIVIDNMEPGFPKT